jgi:hypothetical protein
MSNISIPNLKLNEVLMLANSFPEPEEGETVVFDFSKTQKFDPLPMLMTGSMIRRYRKNIHPYRSKRLDWME